MLDKKSDSKKFQDIHKKRVSEKIRHLSKKPKKNPLEFIGVLERIVNATVRYDDMDDNDIITYEESYERILTCGIGTALTLIVPATLLTVLFCAMFMSTNLPFEILPNITVKNSNICKFNINIISSNGVNMYLQWMDILCHTLL